MQYSTELAEIVCRHLGFDSIEPCAIPRVKLVRSSIITDPIPVVYEPALCLVVQGRKRVVLGERDYIYDASQYLVVSVDLPLMGSVLERIAVPE